jgi:PAS domain S-box-containing protein
MPQLALTDPGSTGLSPDSRAAPIPRASILLVDDQPARLLTYEAILSGLDVHCVRAHSGSEGLEKLLRQEFAVVLLDVQMPDIDGFEVARMVREHPRLERMPIIFVTGAHISVMDQLRGYEVGAIDYIAVPVVPEILRSKVAVLVELYQRRNELRLLNAELSVARQNLEAEHSRALASKEQQLRAVFEHPDQITTVLEAERDGQGAIQDWIYREANSNAARLLGLTRETLLGRRMSTLFEAERFTRLSALCERVRSNQERTRYEAVYENRDYLVTIFPIDENLVVSSGMDITDRKLAEAARREGERTFKALVENAPVGVAHNTLDGRFVYVNEAFCKLSGYGHDELLRMTWQDITHADDVGEDLRHTQLVLDGLLDHYTMEKRYVRRDGCAVWVSLYVNYVRDDAGRPLTSVAVAVDITERRRADAALRDSELRFRELANNINQFAWTCDELGQATWYNDRWYEYTGTSFDDMAGEGWKKVLDPAHLPRVEAGLKRCFQTGATWEDTYPLRARDGSYRWFLSRAVQIRPPNGKPGRWFGTNTDVTELRELHEALELADRRKDEFLAMLAHELRNPVAPILSVAEALGRLLARDDKQQALVKIVQRQAQHLSRLLDDLLDVARITQGRIELRREPLALSACIEAAQESIEPQLRAKRQDLRMFLASDVPPVHGDRVRLAQCIGNLLSNASKYSDAGTIISLSTRREADWAVLEIRDQGCGIDAAFLPHVFDLFAQSGRSLDRSLGGLGIGLSVCRKLIELHGGRVEATSEGTGRGSVFSLRLPAASAAQPDAMGAQSTLGAALRVLIIDDNSDAADSMAMLLQIEGHVVATAYTPEDGMAKAATFDPNVVLLDIGLPRIDGCEVARRLRASGLGARLIAVTGYGEERDRKRAAAAGFHAHLAKPVDYSALGEVLRQA